MNRSRRFRSIIALVLTGLIAGTAAGIGLVAVYFSTRIAPGIAVYGIPIGGLTPSEAIHRLNVSLNHLVSEPITLVLEEMRSEVTPEALGIELATDVAVAQALGVTRTGPLIQRLEQLFHSRKGRYNLPVGVHVADSSLNDWLDHLAEQLAIAPEDARFQLDAEHRLYIVPDKQGRQLDRAQLQRALLATVVRAEDRELAVPIRSVSARVRSKDLANLNLRHQIGTFTTRFTLDDPNRVHNIRLAAQTLDGTLLAPGERFSFNSRVGPRMAEAGYKEAPVIVYGELIPDTGGGVCQVSTTLYNAALLAGLRIDTRSPHSIPPTYVPLGMDAAVSYGQLDLQLSNTTDGHVYITSSINEDELVVTIFGSHGSAGYQLVTSIEEVIPPSIQEVPDPNLPPGAIEVDRQGRNGYEVILWRVELTDSVPKRTVVGQSTYPSRDRVVRIGER